MDRDAGAVPGDERGALSPMVAVLALMIFLLAGLVIDGGRQLGARARAVGYAQEAARAGAAAIELNTDAATIDVVKAEDAVDTFCDAILRNDPTVTDCGTSELDTEHLQVRVRINNPTTFLGMIGVTSLDANGVGEAHAEQGIYKADETPTIPSLSVLPTSEDPGVPVYGTAAPPSLEVPCPEWTTGSPRPEPSWEPPVPAPATCTPNLPPTDPPPPPSPTDPPSTTPPTTADPPNPSDPPGSGDTLPPGVPSGG